MGRREMQSQRLRMRGVSWKANTQWERGVLKTRWLPVRQVEGTEGCVPARDGKGRSRPVGKWLQCETVRRVPHSTEVLWPKLVTACSRWERFACPPSLSDGEHCDLDSPKSRLFSVLD